MNQIGSDFSLTPVNQAQGMIGAIMYQPADGDSSLIAKLALWFYEIGFSETC